MCINIIKTGFKTVKMKIQKYLFSVILLPLCFFAFKSKPENRKSFHTLLKSELNLVDTITKKQSVDALVDKNIALKTKQINNAAYHNTEDVYKLLKSSIRTINETYEFAHQQRLEKDSVINIARQTKTDLKLIVNSQNKLLVTQNELKKELEIKNQLAVQYELGNIFLNWSVNVAFSGIVLMYIATILIVMYINKKKLKA